MRIELDPDLAQRLYVAARRLGRTAEDCARSAVLTFVEDCEQTQRLRAQLGGGDESWVRDPDWMD